MSAQAQSSSATPGLRMNPPFNLSQTSPKFEFLPAHRFNQESSFSLTTNHHHL